MLVQLENTLAKGTDSGMDSHREVTEIVVKVIKVRVQALAVVELEMEALQEMKVVEVILKKEMPTDRRVVAKQLKTMRRYSLQAGLIQKVKKAIYMAM